VSIPAEDRAALLPRQHRLFERLAFEVPVGIGIEADGHGGSDRCTRDASPRLQYIFETPKIDRRVQQTHHLVMVGLHLLLGTGAQGASAGADQSEEFVVQLPRNDGPVEPIDVIGSPNIQESHKHVIAPAHFLSDLIHLTELELPPVLPPLEGLVDALVQDSFRHHAQTMSREGTVGLEGFHPYLLLEHEDLPLEVDRVRHSLGLLSLHQSNLAVEVKLR